jgi:hypothetical protein
MRLARLSVLAGRAGRADRRLGAKVGKRRARKGARREWTLQDVPALRPVILVAGSHVPVDGVEVGN